jgi:hypothetical protein
MVDYYTVMARAVSGLPKNTAAARQILYERARAALVTTLTGQNPPVAEADVERERLALEKVFRKWRKNHCFSKMMTQKARLRCQSNRHQ